MQEHNGLTAERLESLGYRKQPDGRLKLRKSWKAECETCKLWFHRLKGRQCKHCDDKELIAYKRQLILRDKRRNNQT
jgi:hypothetical protein